MKKDEEKYWKKPDGSLVSCTEKVKVLNENFDEIKHLLQDAIDDAVLMGCSEEMLKRFIWTCLTPQKQLIQRSNR